MASHRVLLTRSIYAEKHFLFLTLWTMENILLDIKDLIYGQN